MFAFPATVRVYLATQPVDLRRGFDGLSALTREILQQDPLSGHLFVFRNRRSDRLKILFFSGGGFCLFYKRLERGVFRIPRSDQGRLEIDGADLGLLIEGIDLSSVKKPKHWIPRRTA